MSFPRTSIASVWIWMEFQSSAPCAKLADGSLRPGRVSRSSKNGCSVALDTLELTVSAFEVLVGAAPGFEIRIVPWAEHAPPPVGAVVVGVSTRGTRCSWQSRTTSLPARQRACRIANLSASRQRAYSTVQFGWQTYNRKMACCGPNCGVVTVVCAGGQPYTCAPALPQPLGLLYGGLPRVVGVSMRGQPSARRRAARCQEEDVAGRVCGLGVHAQSRGLAPLCTGADLRERRRQGCEPVDVGLRWGRGGESGIISQGVDSNSWVSVKLSFGLGGLHISFGDGVDDSLRPDSSGLTSASTGSRMVVNPRGRG